jgi:hypothetical protein
VAFSQGRQNQARGCAIKTGGGSWALRRRPAGGEDGGAGQAACHVYRSAILCTSALRAARKHRPSCPGRSRRAKADSAPPLSVGIGVRHLADYQRRALTARGSFCFERFFSCSGPDTKPDKLTPKLLQIIEIVKLVLLKSSCFTGRSLPQLRHPHAGSRGDGLRAVGGGTAAGIGQREAPSMLLAKAAGSCARDRPIQRIRRIRQQEECISRACRPSMRRPPRRAHPIRTPAVAAADRGLRRLLRLSCRGLRWVLIAPADELM